MVAEDAILERFTARRLRIFPVSRHNPYSFPLGSVCRLRIFPVSRHNPYSFPLGSVCRLRIFPVSRHNSYSFPLGSVCRFRIFPVSRHNPCRFMLASFRRFVFPPRTCVSHAYDLMMVDGHRPLILPLQKISTFQVLDSLQSALSLSAWDQPGTGVRPVERHRQCRQEKPRRVYRLGFSVEFPCPCSSSPTFQFASLYIQCSVFEISLTHPADCRLIFGQKILIGLEIKYFSEFRFCAIVL